MSACEPAAIASIETMKGAAQPIDSQSSGSADLPASGVALATTL